MLDPWTGPHGGTPPFDRIKPDQFKPALSTAMDQMRAEILAITGNPAPPTFENTIVALEDAGRALTRVASLFGVYTSTMNDKQMQKIEEEMAPVLAAFSDEITQNAALFARIQAVHAHTSDRLTDTVWRNFAHKGAALGDADKTRLKAINQQLATLYTRFSQNVLADEESHAIVVRDAAELEGLPASVVTSAKTADGTWRFANSRSAIEPLLTYAARRDLRERAWRMFTSRGDNNDAHDNKAIITQILALRRERANLLGYPTHAHWIIDDNMARTPDAAMALMMKVWKAAVARARDEIADMQKLAPEPIEPWDHRYYAEKVRKARFDLDQNEIKPYLQLEKLREAMFWAAGQLYNFTFTQLSDVPVYHPDVRVYEVTRGGDHVGLWYFDPYAREGKQSGAWMSEYRTQEAFKQRIAPIVSNNSNFVKGEPGQPVLISWDDAVTLFHEFGHALHGLCSSVPFPTLAGTNVKRDFVEFPSQLNEHWLRTPELLDRFALHYQTGEPLPAALRAKIEKAKHFNEGFRTVEYLAAAIYDLKVHTEDTDEARVLAEIGCPREIGMRHRPPHFLHIFSGDGYSAGYYSYIWADTLTADAAEAFAQAGSFYDPATAQRLFASIMSVGNSVPPEIAFRNFRGRDVDTEALMRDRGLHVGL